MLPEVSQCLGFGKHSLKDGWMDGWMDGMHDEQRRVSFMGVFYDVGLKG